jgi:hypothetical protein
VGIDLGGFFEDSDTTGSTFGFTPISPNWRFVSCGWSLASLEGEVIRTPAIFTLYKEMALKMENTDPINNKPTTACAAFANKSDTIIMKVNFRTL